MWILLISNYIFVVLGWILTGMRFKGLYDKGIRDRHWFINILWRFIKLCICCKIQYIIYVRLLNKSFIILNSNLNKFNNASHLQQDLISKATTNFVNAHSLYLIVSLIEQAFYHWKVEILYTKIKIIISFLLREFWFFWQGLSGTAWSQSNSKKSYWVQIFNQKGVFFFTGLTTGQFALFFRSRGEIFNKFLKPWLLNIKTEEYFLGAVDIININLVLNGRIYQLKNPSL